MPQILQWFCQFFTTALTCFHREHRSFRKKESKSHAACNVHLLLEYSREDACYSNGDVIHFLEFIPQSKKNTAHLQRLKEQKFIMQQRSRSPGNGRETLAAATVCTKKHWSQLAMTFQLNKIFQHQKVLETISCALTALKKEY